MAPPRHPRPRSGLTLVEVLLAASLGALLLMAAAQAAGMFAEQVRALTADDQLHLEEAVETILHDVRHAWWVEVTDGTATIVTGADGAETTYLIDGDRLSVNRHDGATDVLLTDLQQASFAATTMSRYREDTPDSDVTSYWWAPTPASAPTALVVEPGQSLALGFVVGSTSPFPPVVDGVTEQVLSARLGQLSITMAGVGVPAAVVTVGGRSSIVSTPARLTVSLHLARGPGDARPDGAALGSIVVPLSTLPAGTGSVKNTANGSLVPAPPGASGLWWKSLPGLAFEAAAPALAVPLDLSAFGREVEPGRAYTLLVALSGDGLLLVKGHALASATGSGVALGPSGAPVPLALAIPRTLSGEVTVTRTRKIDVVTRLDVAFAERGGGSVRGSVMVAGQVLAPHPWLGVVPGELPTLENWTR